MPYKFNPLSGKLDIVNPELWKRGSGVLYPKTLTDKIGIGTDAPVDDLSFGGLSNRTVGLLRNTTATEAGKSLTQTAGGATLGEYDKEGGSIKLYGGISTGAADSKVILGGYQRINIGTPTAWELIAYFGVLGGTYYSVGEECVIAGGNMDAVIRVDTIIESEPGYGSIDTFTVLNYGTGYYLFSQYGVNGGAWDAYVRATAITGNSDNSLVDVLTVSGNKAVGINTSDPLANLHITYSQIYGVDSTNPNAFAITNYSGIVDWIDWTGAFHAPKIKAVNSDGMAVVTLDRDSGIEVIGNINTQSGGIGVYQNYLVASEDFANGPWENTACTVTSNTIVAPNGTTTADSIVGSDTTAEIKQSFVGTFTAGEHVASVWMKVPSGTLTTYVVCNLAWSGGGTTGGGACDLTDQWQRFYFYADSGANTPISAYFAVGGSYGSFGTNTIHIWGAQFEKNTIPGVYIKTDYARIDQSTGFVSNGNIVASGMIGAGIQTPVASMDVLGSINGSVIPAPDPPLINTATTGGSVTSGAHSWKVTFVNAYGETTPGVKSVTKSTVSIKKTFLLEGIPIGPTGTTSRKIYRTTAGTAEVGPWKLLTTIANNTATTFTDTIADGSLGVNAPTSNTTANLGLSIGGTAIGNFDNAGKLYLGGTTLPTAILHLKAGTATASTAPLKLTSGALLATPEAGAQEFLTDDFYATITTGAARKKFVLDNGVNLVSGRVPFATTNGRLVDDSDLTFSGSRLTTTDLTVTNAPIISSLTAGRVVFAGASKELVDDADFTFNTDTLTVSKIAATTFVGNITLSTKDLVTDTTTGSKLATAVDQKLGFWNATPIVQPASANQAALTNSTGGSYDGTLADVTASFDQSILNNNFTDLYTLLTEIRTALVNAGLMKGAA